VVNPSDFTDVEIEGECLLWREGQRFPVDDDWFDSVGHAVADDLARWWRVVRVMALEAKKERPVTNVSYVLAAGCAVRPECLTEIIEDAVAEPKLRSLVANAIQHGAFRGLTEQPEVLVLELFGKEAVVESWLRNSRSSSVDIDFWAWEIVGDLVTENSGVGWELILGLLAKADSDVIGNIGAGPLEAFIAAYGDDLVAQIVDECRANQQLRDALATTWIWDDVSAQTFKRLEDAACKPLPVPDAGR
jgi:hypothetical protein